MPSTRGRFSQSIKSFVDTKDEGDDEWNRGPDDRFRNFCREQGWRPVGLNADWRFDVYQINPAGQDSRHGLVAADNEDSGTFTVAFAMAPEKAEELIGYGPGEEPYWTDPRTYKELFNGSFEEFQAFCLSNQQRFKNFRA